MSINKKIKHLVFRLQNKSLKNSLQNTINKYFEHSEYIIQFDQREPHHADTLCFWILKKHSSKKMFFGKLILNLHEPSLENAGIKRFKGQEFINETLKIQTSPSTKNIPKAFLVAPNILLFQYLNYPTFKSLYEKGYCPFELFSKSIKSLRILHSYNITHYDPNWENILYDKDLDQAYFIDFDRKLIENNLTFKHDFFDIFKTYTNMFELKYTKKWAIENQKELIKVYARSITSLEKQTILNLSEDDLITYFPKISKKPHLKSAIYELKSHLKTI